MFCVFLTQSWRKREKIAFPSNICTKNDFLKKLKRSGKNSRNFQEKTQENIQKLKQNEHQVLSCTQKKCKINTSDICAMYCYALIFFHSPPSWAHRLWRSWLSCKWPLPSCARIWRGPGWWRWRPHWSCGMCGWGRWSSPTGSSPWPLCDRKGSDHCAQGRGHAAYPHPNSRP